MINIDHIVYVVPDLKFGIDYFKKLTGAQIYEGGKHLTKGTHNAIFRIGKNSYFEILAPDPKRNKNICVNWLGTQNTEVPRISRWCANCINIEEGVSFLNEQSKYSYQIENGSRKKTDDSLLEWKLGLTNQITETDVFPFIIDWGTSLHPSHSLAQECEVEKLVLSHSCSEKVKKILHHFDIQAEVITSDNPSIQLILATPNGSVTIK